MNFWQKLSLKARLTFIYAGLLIIILFVLGITFFIDTRNLLIENTASHIRARAKPIIEHWLYSKELPSSKKEKPSFTPSPRYIRQIAQLLTRDLTSRETVAVLITREGKIIANGKLLPEEPSPPQPNPFYYKMALSGKNEVDYITCHNGKKVLVILIPLREFPSSKNILGVIQLSSSLSSVEEILYRHGLTLAIGTFIALFVGTALARLLISSGLTDLRQMIFTCQKISEGNLDQRVNLPQRQDEIGQLAQAFDNMIDKVEATFESQRRFVANVAHELRTPLTALQGSLEVLLRGAQDDPASVARLSQGMYREVKRLSRLCEKLLDIAKLEVSQGVQKKPVILSDFFHEFIPQVKILAKGRNVKFHKGAFVTIHIDPDILKQILFNLTYNAVQHTAEDGTIIMGWKLIPGGVQIWVEDDGEGIDPEDLPHIFEPFYRGKKTHRRKAISRGTGLGLTLTKVMVEALNGWIQVKSEPGNGTIFTLNFPL